MEKHLAEHDEHGHSQAAITDSESAYMDAYYIIVADPAYQDPKTNTLDCSAVKAELSIR